MRCHRFLAEALMGWRCAHGVQTRRQSGGLDASVSSSPATASSSTDPDSLASVRIEHTIDILPQSVLTKMKTAFWNNSNKKCILCEEMPATTQKLHYQYVIHHARMGIVERALSGVAGCAPEELPRVTWKNLNHPSLTFHRLQSLSADGVQSRRRRVFSLLNFLSDRGVLKYSLSVFTSGVLHRNASFETCEMIGDNVIKYLLNDRLQAMFPPHQGGISGGLFSVQQSIDSNEGLRQLYDHLDMDQLVGCYMPNSKAKSDIVESLFGELQAILWAAEMQWDTVGYSFVLAAEERYLIALVRHVLEELGHIWLQWVVEETLRRSQKLIDEVRSLLPPRRNDGNGGEDTTALRIAQVCESKLKTLPLLTAGHEDQTMLRPSTATNSNNAYLELSRTAIPPVPASIGSSIPVRVVSCRTTYDTRVAAVIHAHHQASLTNVGHVVTVANSNGTAPNRAPSSTFIRAAKPVLRTPKPIIDRRFVLHSLALQRSDVYVCVDANRLWEALVSDQATASIGCVAESMPALSQAPSKQMSQAVNNSKVTARLELYASINNCVAVEGLRP